MNIKKHILILLCLFAAVVQGQNYSTDNKKAIKLYDKAVTAIQRGNMGEAKEHLEQSLQEAPDFIEAHLMMVDLLEDAIEHDKRQAGEDTPLNIQHRAEAKKHLRAVVERQRDFFPMAFMKLGRMELTDGNFDEAIRSFEYYLSLNKIKKEDSEEAENGIATARFRKEALAHPVPFEPKNLGAGINSADDEYLPSLTADGQTLVFTRRFPRKATTTANTKQEEDLYMSTLKDGQWSTAVRMPEPVNSNDNEGAQCISQDGRIMFYTACNREDGGGRCDLYMCVNKGGKWSKPRNLGSDVNSGAWEGQPTFSIDGKTLYFVSNRKGGYGGMDIWQTTFENGRWTEPINLGPQINSKWDEMSPFIHFDDKTLYFASNRPVGMGGADIFVSRQEAHGGWSAPENLGYPINTQYDDNNLIVSADGRTAIFASQRKGFGKMDLYSFELPVEARPTVAICFKGTVTNANTGAKVGGDIRVVDIANGETVANTSSDARSGEYIVSLPAGRNYAFYVSADGYLFYSQNVENGERGMGEAGRDPTDQGNGEWRPVVVDIMLHPIESGERIALRNVFFASGKYELLPESQYELNKVVELLEKNPTLKIELGGHTDNVGRSEDNQRLSEQRAKAVYEYLTSKGIAASRLTYKGYGETIPVTTNDTNEGRAENRRTEIKIM